ncbi:hypothetical protein ABRY23_01995 [Melioribacteraceae bacterium 4301-Me]|uniref:hypothetical protein n=1 Tax=Pyranulibacter aquaticus TaxID=3163344 RepID=UPI003599135D
MKAITLILLLTLIVPITAQQEKIPMVEINYPDSLNVIRRAVWGWLPLQDTIKQQHEFKYIKRHLKNKIISGCHSHESGNLL